MFIIIFFLLNNIITVEIGYQFIWPILPFFNNINAIVDRLPRENINPSQVIGRSNNKTTSLITPFFHNSDQMTDFGLIY